MNLDPIEQLVWSAEAVRTIARRQLRMFEAMSFIWVSEEAQERIHSRYEQMAERPEEREEVEASKPDKEAEWEANRAMVGRLFGGGK